MKKRVLLAIMFLSLTPILTAQVKPFRFGFQIAPSFSWISPDSEGYDSDGANMGFAWGFLSDFALTENYFVSTGFNMEYLSGKLNYPHAMALDPDTSLLTPGDLARKYRLRYLEVPLCLRMRTNKFGSVSYFGQIGFGTAFNLRAKSSDTFSYVENNISLTNEKDRDIKEEVRFLRETLIIGGGIEYFIDESTSVIAGITFQNGLTNILKGQNERDPDIDQKAILHYFTLKIGVLF
ncbi:MAG: PorT family protein [Bacteroidales bacterium]|nr:PorT family protein [Bacteroidales bacterium]